MPRTYGKPSGSTGSSKPVPPNNNMNNNIPVTGYTNVNTGQPVNNMARPMQQMGQPVMTYPENNQSQYVQPQQYVQPPQQVFSQPMQPAQPTPPPKKSHTGLIIGIACFIVALVGIGGFLLIRNVLFKVENGVSGSKEELVEKVFNSINSKDADELIKCFPDKKILDEDSYNNIQDAVTSLTTIENFQIDMSSVEYTSSEEIDLKDFKSEYHISVEEAYDMTVNVGFTQTVDNEDEGTSDTYECSEDFKFVIAKLRGKWLVFYILADKNSVAIYKINGVSTEGSTEATTEEEVTTEEKTEEVTEEKTEEKTEEPTTEAKTEEPTTEAHDVTVGDNVVDFTGKSFDKSMLRLKTVLIDGEAFTMPFGYNDIKDKMFFNISDYGNNGVAYDESYTLNAGQYVLMTLKPVNPLEEYHMTTFSVHLANVTAEPIKIYDSAITGIEVDFDDKTANKDITFVAPGGATYNWTTDKVKSTYGDPDDIYTNEDNPGFAIYTYSYDEENNNYTLKFYFDDNKIYQISFDYTEH